MLLDYNNLFHEDTVIGAAGSYPGDSLDLESTTPRQIGSGGLLRVFAQVTGAMTGGTNIKAQLVSDTVATLASPTVLYETPVVPTATAVAGYKFNIPAFPVANIAERYVGVVFVSVGVHTVPSTVSAGIQDEGDQQMDDGYTAVTGY